MARPKLPSGEKKEAFVVYIEQKYLHDHGTDVLRDVARKSIIKYNKIKYEANTSKLPRI